MLVCNNIVLIGGGNHAHYTIDIIEKEGKYNIIGIIDSLSDVGSYKFGYEIVGRQEDLLSLINEYNIDGGIISIGDNWIRYNIYNQIIAIKPDFNFVNAIHPSVIIGNTTTIGKGIIAMAGCIFNPLVKIGDFTFFATGSQVEHDCTIGDFSSVSAGSIMGGYVTLGRFSAITLGVTILDRVSIGENSVIGSGSLVTKNIENDVLVYGSPAKVIRRREKGERFLK